MRGKVAWQKAAWLLLNPKLFKNSLKLLDEPKPCLFKIWFKKMKAKKRYLIKILRL